LKLVGATFNPYLFLDANGQALGSDYDIWKIYANKYDLTFEYKFEPSFLLAAEQVCIFAIEGFSYCSHILGHSKESRWIPEVKPLSTKSI